MGISIPYGAIKRASSKITFLVNLSFQFLMVRLKEQLSSVYGCNGTLFQFLMVRLKVEHKIVECLLPEFQFLMVRLKVGNNAFYNSVFTFQFLMVRLKGATFAPLFIFILLFQFLMVRLKGGSEWDFELLEEISIPYGAIKRPVVVYDTWQVASISIPYGAIKRLYLHLFHLLRQYFNSLWCD